MIHISAVSFDLISHINIMSGSCLRTAFSQISYVYHLAAFICDCCIQASWYSTGSSNVIIFLSPLFK
ncbi:MAG: hypothetical protein WCG25_03520 [bacterium]